MRKKYFWLLLLSSLAFISINASFKKKPVVLVFSKTNGFRHASIPAGIAAIKKLGAENGFDVDATEDSTWFTKKKLKKYDALIFLSTSGKVFGHDEEEALQDYIHHGGGFVGIHGATTTEYDWPWYGRLVGAYFDKHPDPQQAKVLVVDKQHPSTYFLPDVWERKDEWYNFKNIGTDIHVLLKVDEHSYTGGKMGDNHPIAWYHEFEGGRSFYTAMGDAEINYTSDTVFLKHILGGIKYAMGNAK